MENKAFFYVDIPTKGVWVEVDQYVDWYGIKAALARQGLIPRENDHPEYGGDILVAGTEGLAKHFLASFDTFNLGGLVDVLEDIDIYNLDEEAVDAYLDNCGTWSREHFEESYCGKYDSLLDYATELFDECYGLEFSNAVKPYIDYESFSHDLECEGYWEENGHIFRPA